MGARLILVHKTSGTVTTLTDLDEIAEGALSPSARDTGHTREAGPVAVKVVAEHILGYASRSGFEEVGGEGPHRCLLYMDGIERFSGTLVRSGVAHGKAYPVDPLDAEAGTVRRWTLRLENRATDSVLEALEALSVLDVSNGAVGAHVFCNTALLDTETSELLTTTIKWYDPLALLVAAIGMIEVDGAPVELVVRDAEGQITTLPALLRTRIPYGAGAVQTIAHAERLCHPAAAMGEAGDVGSLTAGTAPPWTALELAEYVWARYGLVFEAAYTDFPAQTVTLTIRPRPTSRPETALPAGARDAADVALDFDRDEESAGEGDDLALVYEGGPNGGTHLLFRDEGGALGSELRVGEYTALWNPPAVGGYAAERFALTGEVEDAEPANRSVLTLRVRLPSITGMDSEAWISGGYAETRHGGTPVVLPSEGRVYVSPILHINGRYRALAYRERANPPKGAAAPNFNEAWALYRFGPVASGSAAVDVVRATLPLVVVRGEGEDAPPVSEDPTSDLWDETVDGSLALGSRVRADGETYRVTALVRNLREHTATVDLHRLIRHAEPVPEVPEVRPMTGACFFDYANDDVGWGPYLRPFAFFSVATHPPGPAPSRYRVDVGFEHAGNLYWTPVEDIDQEVGAAYATLSPSGRIAIYRVLVSNFESRVYFRARAVYATGQSTPPLILHTG